MSNSFPFRMLIVDRNAEVRRDCAFVASQLGLYCAEAESGQAAMLYLRRELPDMVLVDACLEDVPGEDLARQIKSAVARTEVALIIRAGEAEPEAEAVRAGTCDYIVKPFTQSQLRLLLERMREKVRLLAEIERLRETVERQQKSNLSHVTHLGEIERATIERVFEQVNGDKLLAGKLLGISRATLYRKLKRYQIGTRFSHAQRGVHA